MTHSEKTPCRPPATRMRLLPRRSLTAVMAMGLSAILGATSAQEAKPETFEGTIPDYIAASRPGTIRLSTTRSKHGSHSLRWDWRGGDSLRIDHGLGNIRRQGGYGGTYSKATFGVWLYSLEALEAELTFAFRTAEQTTGSFVFPLTFTGWRRAHLRYSWRPQFDGNVSPDTDNILVEAPETGSGTVFIDLLTYNGILDYRRQYVPTAEPWERPPRDPETFPIPEAVSEDERTGLQLVERRMQDAAKGSLVVDEDLVENLRKEVQSWRIRRLPDGTLSGRPIVKEPGFYTELGLDDVDGPTDICNLMMRIAGTHAQCENPAVRQTLENWYLLLADHIHDQGMTAGSGFDWGWYPGRDLATATFLMRDVLRQHGRLERDGDYFDSNYGFSRVFDDSTIRPNMDHFHLNVRNMLRGALMQTSETERVRCLKAVSRRLTLDIMYTGPNGFRPDGSAFHHNMHYFAYANYSMNTLCQLLSHLAGTTYQVSPQALARIKTVLLNLRFTCNFIDLPLPLCGRHPHSQRLGTQKFLWLATAMGGRDHALDTELTAAYLRFYPEQAADTRFQDAGLRPEPHPQGELSMPHAGLLAIRRNHWLALIKGYSRYVKFGEIYANNNRFGRYLSHGYLDILAGGDPVTREDSGCTPAGWDWNRLDGTTVVVLPTDKLRAVRKGTESVPTDEVFCGAAVSDRGEAVFGLVLQGAERHDGSFHARKSYHWLPAAGMIVCLGAGIECADPEHPVQTTLFQKTLAAADQPILLNGRPWTGIGEERILAANDMHWLIDTQNTGYLVPPGPPLTVTRRHQVNRDQRDETDTHGDFACAWLDHGTQSRNGGYHYAVMPDTQATVLEHTVAEMRSESPPYRVLARTPALHAIEYRVEDGHTISAACFEPGILAHPDQAMPTIDVDGPCLLIVRQTPGALAITVCDPDLRLDDDYESRQAVRVLAIQGDWQLPPGRNGTGVTVRKTQGKTLVAVTCRDGRSVPVRLTR